MFSHSTLHLFVRRSKKSENRVVAGNIVVSFAKTHFVSNNSCTTPLRESQIELPRDARPSSVPAGPHKNPLAQLPETRLSITKKHAQKVFYTFWYVFCQMLTSV